MRSNLFLLAIAVGSIGAVGRAAAQRSFSPDSARPPLLLRATPEEQLRVAVSLQMQRIEHAIQRGDTATLGLLIPDAVIPDAEKPVAVRAGCRSLPHALSKLSARPMARRVSPGLPLGFVHYEAQRIATRGDGDTIAVFAALLVDRSDKAHPKFVPVRFALVKRGVGIGLARAPGLLAGLCGMAVTP